MKSFVGVPTPLRSAIILFRPAAEGEFHPARRRRLLSPAGHPGRFHTPGRRSRSHRHGPPRTLHRRRTARARPGGRRPGRCGRPLPRPGACRVWWSSCRKRAIRAAEGRRASRGRSRGKRPTPYRQHPAAVSRRLFAFASDPRSRDAGGASGVDGGAVMAGDNGDILGRLQPSFDVQRRDPRAINSGSRS